MPAIAEARRPSKRGRAMPGNQDGWMGTLHRFGAESRLLKLVIAPLEGGRLLRPERLADLQVLVCAASTLMKWHLQHIEFFLKPAHADAEENPALGEDIGARHLLGDLDRVAHGQDQDA